MLGIPFASWLMLGIGFLFGLLVGNKEFRVKFFKGLRSFLSSTSKGAREQEQRHNEELKKMQEGLQQHGRNVVGRVDKRKPEEKPHYHEH